jgi:hypothetical protein|tara:strand:+ start:1235 stop:1444 length:210 start_codon:yes stop_codon:yes gene_type:complete
MEESLKLIGEYGITLVLLIGSLYVLYRFAFFSINEVKVGFEKRHTDLRSDMEEIKKQLLLIEAYIKSKS